jgi:hypothetical protein
MLTQFRLKGTSRWLSKRIRRLGNEIGEYIEKRQKGMWVSGYFCNNIIGLVLY